MKMVFISFFEGKTDEVLELLESEHVESYTHWPKTHGKAAGFRPRMGTQVWPGNNGAVLFFIEDDQVEQLLDKVDEFNQETEYEGLSAFVFDIARMAVKKPKE